MNEKVITIIMVRHAEVNKLGGDNPALNANGLDRAQTLVRLVGKADITALYSTQLQRTIQTIQPLANYLNLEVNKISDVGTLVRQIISIENGKVAFIVGHTNTIPEIIKQLGGNPIVPITEDEFDNMYIITLYMFDGNENEHVSTRVLHLKYGN